MPSETITRPTAARGLSRLQQRLLVRIRNAELHGAVSPGWGVFWRCIQPRRPTRSCAAAVSRSIRRLEERGLVRRRNQMSGDRWSVEIRTRQIAASDWPLPVHPDDLVVPDSHRSTHIELTAEGHRTADWLIASCENG